MNQRTQRTPPTAKKFAEAFIRKANSLENKLREMCKTASACKVSNDVIVSNLMKTVCNEMFVRENEHALHERYKSLHSGIMDSLKEEAADLTKEVEKLSLNQYPTCKFTDMNYEQMVHFRSYLDTMKSCADFEMRYGDKQAMPFIEKPLYSCVALVKVLELMEANEVYGKPLESGVENLDIYAALLY